MSNLLPAQNDIQNAADQGTQKTNLENQRDFISSLLGGASETELTISAGNITPPTRDGGGQYNVDNESDSASDDLSNILTTNIPDGQFIIIRPNNAARTVVVKDTAGGAGQMILQNNADFSMTDIDMSITLRRRAADWFEVSRQYGANAVLDDLAILSPVANNEMIVGTGAGVYAHESGATLRTSIGVGTANSITLSSLTLTGVLSAHDGTVGAPSITNTGDLDTGLYFPAANTIGFVTLGVEEYRLTPDGSIQIGKTDNTLANVGMSILNNGKLVHITGSGANSQLLINNTDTDTNMVGFFQANNLEGAISISGATVTYGGGHFAFLSQLTLSHAGGRRDNTIKRGTVMEYVNERAEWYYEDWEEEEVIPEIVEMQETGLLDATEKPILKSVVLKEEELIKHPKRLVVDGMDGSTGKGVVHKKVNNQKMRTKISDTVGTSKQAGVFQAWDNANAYNNRPEDNNTWDYDFYVATTGDFHIRITGSCMIGDLVESNGDGTAVIQKWRLLGFTLPDWFQEILPKIIFSSTVAKITQDFSGIPEGQENPELVPCQLLNG